MKNAKKIKNVYHIVSISHIFENIDFHARIEIERKTIASA